MSEVITVVYTDGACLGNPGPGGWAWVIPGGNFSSGHDPWTTNQRMELTGVIEALACVEGRIEVASDSTYVVNCFRDRWWEAWIRRGWRTARGKEVANRDLWQPLVETALDRDVRFRWVKGHGTDEMNAIADALANEAARTQDNRSGKTAEA